MKLGVGEWGFRNLDMEEHCKITSKLGFHYMELGIGGGFKGRLSADMSEEQICRMKECFADYHIQTPFLCLENDFTKGSAEEIDRSVQQVKKEALLAQNFGVTHLRLFAGFTPIADFTEQTWKNLLRALEETNQFCKQLQMKISIETHGKLEKHGDGVIHIPTVSTDQQALSRLLCNLDDNVGINFDPGNIVPLQKASPESYVERFNDRINYCHLKDWIQNEDGSWTAVAAGEGNIDWKNLLSRMTFDGVYLIEYEPTEDVEDGIRRSLTHLRSLFPELLQ